MRCLPIELVDQILYYLDNKEYLLCRGTNTLFHVSSKKEWQYRKYVDTDFYTILYNGDLEGVKYHLRIGSKLITDRNVDPKMYSHISYLVNKEEIICAVVALQGHLHILRELISMDFNLNEELAVYAVRGHQLEFLKYLHFIGYEGRGISYHLTYYNDLPGIRWYHAINDRSSFPEINLDELYDHRTRNYIQGNVYNWDLKN